MKATLGQAAAMMNGALESGDREFEGVSIDSRSIAAGELFFALSGPNFDGLDFVADAHERGAAGAVVRTKVQAGIAQIVVDDTRAALGRLGAAWRARHRAIVVGVTGSNGKTTLKEMIAAILKSVGPTLATEGNLNNDLGVPLMLTRIGEEHRFAVLEMGANHQREIAYLASLAKPDVVTITNAGPAHLEGFGGLDGVARGKGEILADEKRPDAAVLNADDRYFDYWCRIAGDVDVISFGIDTKADVSADNIYSGGGRMSFRLHVAGESADVALPLVGRHNVRNACAAAAVAHALGIDAQTISRALGGVRAVSGRLSPMAARSGAALYDDSYNANPTSVLAAAEFVAGLAGESWLVLGDMGELGADARRLHRELGESLRKTGVTRLYALGELSRHAAEGFGAEARWFDSVEALTTALDEALQPGVNVIVKGSRFMKMERIVRALATAGTPGGEGSH